MRKESVHLSIIDEMRRFYRELWPQQYLAIDQRFPPSILSAWMMGFRYLYKMDSERL
jgi:hypothetical protein